MKKVTAIALVLIMSLQCFYKLGVITYFHLNRDYIAEVLCINKEEPISMCHGQCFLDKTLEIADAAASENAPVPLNTKNVEFPIFLLSENNFAFGGKMKFTYDGSHYRTGISSAHVTMPFHPPTLLS